MLLNRLILIASMHYNKDAIQLFQVVIRNINWTDMITSITAVHNAPQQEIATVLEHRLQLQNYMLAFLDALQHMSEVQAGGKVQFLQEAILSIEAVQSHESMQGE